MLGSVQVGQTWEERLRQGNRFGNAGTPPNRADPADAHHPGTRGKGEPRPLLGACLRHGYAQYATFRKLALACIGDQAEELEKDTALIVQSHECTAALATHEQVLRHQRIERLAHRPLAYPELHRQHLLARQHRAGRPGAFAEPP